MSDVHALVKAGNNSGLLALLESSPEVIQESDELGNSPLHTATYNEQFEVVKILLSHGAAIDATGANRYTALHIAVEEDAAEIAALLLDSGADATIRNSLGWTVVHHAARSNPEIVDLLADHGLKLDAPAALRLGRLDEASNLLDADNSPSNVLFEAAIGSPHEIEALSLLFSRGYSPNEGGSRPPIISVVELALSDRRDNVLRLLLENGADPNASASNGITPLSIASRYGRSNDAPGSAEDVQWAEHVEDILKRHGATE